MKNRIRAIILITAMLIGVMSMTFVAADEDTAVIIEIGVPDVTDTVKLIGDAIYSAASNNDHVIITGEFETDALTLSVHIPEGKKIDWRADYINTGAKSIAVTLIGNGLFEVSGGEINASGGGVAINADRPDSRNVHVTVKGGKVTSNYENEYDFYSTIFMGTSSINSTSLVTVSGGIVENTANGSAIKTNGSVSVEGDGVVRSNTESLIEGDSVLSNNTISAISLNMPIYVNVSGGTVSSESGQAIYLAGMNPDIKLTISGGEVTSNGIDKTIGLMGLMTRNNAVISGGVVKNTSSGFALTTDGHVTVTGGEVSSNTGTAIQAIDTNSRVAVVGGEVKANTGKKFDVAGDNGIVVERTGNGTDYLPGSTDDITTIGEGAAAYWYIKDGKHGISFSRNDNGGFVEVEGVTVEEFDCEVCGEPITGCICIVPFTGDGWSYDSLTKTLTLTTDTGTLGWRTGNKGDDFQFSDVTEVIIGEEVTGLSLQTFYGCTGLTTVTIPDNVKSIGGSVFGGCTNLTTVTIGSGVTQISNSAFDNCPNLVDINVDSECWGFYSVDGVLFGRTGLRVSIFFYPRGKTADKYEVPYGVTGISFNAFANNTKLTAVTIPESVGVIADHAFRNCTSLESVIIPDGVKIINANTFDGCVNMTSVTIGSSVVRVENQAFYNCPNLSVYFRGTPPVSITSNAFSVIGSVPARFMYVPIGLKEEYQAVPQFGVFNIVEYCYDCDNEADDCVCYTTLIISEVNLTEGYIELYNPSNKFISTKGLFLTNAEEDYKWQMPSVIVRAGEIVRVKIEGNNGSAFLKRMQVDSELNVGDSLRLVTASGEVVS